MYGDFSILHPCFRVRGPEGYCLKIRLTHIYYVTLHHALVTQQADTRSLETAQQTCLTRLRKVQANFTFQIKSTFLKP